MAVIVLVQKNLRLHDNPALRWASECDQPVLIIYAAEEQDGIGHLWWRDQSLDSFASDLKQMDIPLFVHEGSIPVLIKNIKDIFSEYQIGWNDEGLGWEKHVSDPQVFEPNYLFYPARVGKSYQRYTPYFKKVSGLAVEKPLPKVKFKSCHVPSKSIQAKFSNYKSKKQKIDFSEYWKPGEDEAQKKWKSFLKNNLAGYDKGRDIPSEDATSGLSAHIHFGEISVRQMWHDLKEKSPSRGRTRYIQELVWREFCYQLLHHFPHMTKFPLQEKYSDFWWENSSRLFTAWKEGQTGFPLVDAGMRELLETGTMHNRVRMIVASFLTKHLGITWQKGAAWFMERLVDADVAQNYANWQWVAGCGADAAPFFRIFNPILQTKRFDPKAEYIKRWVPELQDVEAKELLKPAQLFDRASVGYAKQIIDLEEHRNIALSEFKSMKKKK